VLARRRDENEINGYGWNGGVLSVRAEDDDDDEKQVDEQPVVVDKTYYCSLLRGMGISNQTK